MRIAEVVDAGLGKFAFLSIQAQDFIEDSSSNAASLGATLKFLSIQAQDFIEEGLICMETMTLLTFLSIQAQDFIEETGFSEDLRTIRQIPEHSSSGLH